MSLREQLPQTLEGSFSRHVKCFGFIGIDFLEDPNLRIPYLFRHFAFVTILLLFFTGQVFYFIKIKEIGIDFADISNAVPCLLLGVQAVYIVTAFSLLGFMAIPFVVSLISWYGDGADRFFYPVQMYLPFAITSKWFYCLVYTVQALSGFVVHVCLYQACDLLICSLVIDVCMLMRLLQYDLENIAVLEKDVYGRHDPVKAEECYLAAKQVARNHQKLLRICENINELYGGIIFTVLCFSSVILCFFGFLTIVFTTMKIQLVKNFLALVETLFIVFCYCLPGQILQDTSSGIADAAYQSMWYKSDLKFRKIIFIIMARSQKPCCLSALGFADMNFNGFCRICSSAWSYLSLLNQMFGDTDFQM